MSEHDEQAVFVDYVLFKYQHCESFLRPLFFAVPNANKRTRWQARTLKQEGLTRGVADLLYLQPRGEYSFLAIEMKDPSQRNRKNALSEDQREFLRCSADAFARWAVCYGADDAIKVFDEYMQLDPVSKNFKMDGE